MLNTASKETMPILCDAHGYTSLSVSEEMLYQNQIPAFAPEVLGKCHGSLYGVLPAIHTRDNHASQGIFTYVRRGGTDGSALPVMMLMFRRTGRSARVLNEGISLDRASFDTFCAYVFETLPDVMQIDFHAIVPVTPSPMQRLAPQHARPCLSWPCTEDIVIHLPESTDIYLGQLGRATRKSIKKHMSRAHKELTNFSHQLISGAALTEDLIRHIVALNHARMARQGRDSALDERATRELIKLLRSQGEAGVIVNGARLCAGTLACRFGDDVFSLVNAHDPAFDYLGLGNLCRHLMILKAIDADAKRFHLMGGNLPAKRATLAERQPLHHVTIYRDRQAVLRDLTTIVRHAGKACAFQLHCWLEDQLVTVPMSWTGRAISILRKRRRRRASRPAPVAELGETSAVWLGR